MKPTGFWHAGEVALQASVGGAERMAEIGPRVIRDHLIEQHQQFYPLLHFVVLGSVDPKGRPWASLRAGPPGFMHSPDPRHLHVDLSREADDPAEAGMDDGDAIALLGIELHTRRRNRLNGVLRRQPARGFDIEVVQSYGNCPKYIRQREARLTATATATVAPDPVWMTQLDARGLQMIRSADTFFVASFFESAPGERQIDVSHRGGKPGFVQVDEAQVLHIPDFLGNFFFNTLGNLLVNPQAGLVFVDFETGDLLQLSGDAEVVLDTPELQQFQGAQRLWRFRARQVVYRPAALPLRMDALNNGESPYSLQTGSWETVAAAERDDG